MDETVQDVYDLGTRRQAKRRERSRRSVSEKSLREVKQVACDGEMEALERWFIQSIREDERFPSGRETRNRGTQICRDSGHGIPMGSFLGNDCLMGLIEDPNLRTILIIGAALASPPALVPSVVPGSAILIDNPPLTTSELALRELEAQVFRLGILVVVLFVYYRRKHGQQRRDEFSLGQRKR